MKLIFALSLLLLIAYVFILPFKLIIMGCIMVYSNSLWGFFVVFFGVLLLRLIKPISIVTGKDYTIF